MSTQVILVQGLTATFMKPRRYLITSHISPLPQFSENGLDRQTASADFVVLLYKSNCSRLLQHVTFSF